MMKVLVVTEKFPPDSVGGAEISLERTLQTIKSNFDVDIHVAVLDGSNTNSSHKGDPSELSIHHLSRLKEWPTTMNSPSSIPSVFNRFRWPTAATKYLIDTRRGRFGDRFERVQLHRRLSKQGNANWRPMFDFDVFSYSETLGALKDLIDRLKPDLIHADNYRSMMLVGALPHPAQCKIGFIRDNRFVCPKPSQTFAIDGRSCRLCDANCLPETIASPEVIKKHWERDLSYRDAALSEFSKLLTTSSFIERSIKVRQPELDVTVVGNPADPIEIVDQFQRGVKRANPPEILVVGMLNSNKGSDRAIALIKALRKKLRDFRVVMAGRGQMGQALLNEAAAQGVADHLILPGFLDRASVYRAYARASVVVAPNRWSEPFGRVPLEAGLSSRPFVGYAIGGIKESVEHGKTGFLCETGDESSLLTFVVNCIDNVELAENLGKKARQKIKKEYGPELIAERIYSQWETQILLQTEV